MRPQPHHAPRAPGRGDSTRGQGSRSDQSV